MPTSLIFGGEGDMPTSPLWWEYGSDCGVESMVGQRILYPFVILTGTKIEKKNIKGMK